jgi:hypothetical protein
MALVKAKDLGHYIIQGVSTAGFGIALLLRFLLVLGAWLLSLLCNFGFANPLCGAAAIRCLLFYAHQGQLGTTWSTRFRRMPEASSSSVESPGVLDSALCNQRHRSTDAPLAVPIAARICTCSIRRNASICVKTCSSERKPRHLDTLLVVERAVISRRQSRSAAIELEIQWGPCGRHGDEYGTGGRAEAQA